MVVLLKQTAFEDDPFIITIIKVQVRSDLRFKRTSSCKLRMRTKDMVVLLKQTAFEDDPFIICLTWQIPEAIN
jgi:hypothetical protein